MIDIDIRVERYDGRSIFKCATATCHPKSFAQLWQAPYINFAAYLVIPMTSSNRDSKMIIGSCRRMNRDAFPSWEPEETELACATVLTPRRFAECEERDARDSLLKEGCS